MTLDDVEKPGDNVTISIENDLEGIVPMIPECSIHRIPKRLLHMNRMAYIPKVISIGPFHHNQHKFKTTEDLKLRFFQSYQCRVGLSVRDIVEKAQNWEEEAQLYYSEPINMTKQEFVKMMILDGCFIVEYLIMDLTSMFPQNKNKVDSSFYEAIDLDISRDLIMLENQLPFFVLQNLFDLIFSSTSNVSIKIFELVVYSYLNLCVLKTMGDGFLYRDILNQRPRHLVDLLGLYFVRMENQNVVHPFNVYPPSATQLSEAGVIFKKVEVEEDETDITDITFENGILKIPPLQIDDKFETCARNLLAFSQFSCGKNCISAVHFFEFLDELITTVKDVNLLVNNGIIRNRIGGSEKEISKMFNDICKNITVPSPNCFQDIAIELKQHCGRKRNRWMTSLKHNYFNSPWTLISFLAATFLIVLTILQTIFTAISTFK